MTTFVIAKPCKRCGDVRRYKGGTPGHPNVGSCPTCHSRRSRDKTARERATRPVAPSRARVAAELELIRQGIPVEQASAMIAERMGPLPQCQHQPRRNSPKAYAT